VFETYEDTIGSVDNYLSVIELSLGRAEDGVLVFEIPQESDSHSFAVGKGRTNEIDIVIKVNMYGNFRYIFFKTNDH
jgi:hypothetical protein